MNFDETLRRAWFAALFGWEGWCLWYGYRLASEPFSPIRLVQPTRFQVIDEAVYLAIGGLAVALVVAWIWRGLCKR